MDASDIRFRLLRDGLVSAFPGLAGLAVALLAHAPLAHPQELPRLCPAGEATTISVTQGGTCELGNGSRVTILKGVRIEAPEGRDAITGRGGITAGAILNRGTVGRAVSRYGILLDDGATVGSITNRGAINGERAGIRLQNGASLDGTILNDSEGTIESEGDAIAITSGATIGGEGILVLAGTTVKGGNHGILVEADSDITGTRAGAHITNRGAIEGGLYAMRLGPVPDGAQRRILHSGTLRGAVALGGWTLAIEGDEAEITGAVSGKGAKVTVGGAFTTRAAFDVDAFEILKGGRLSLSDDLTATRVTNGGTLSLSMDESPVIGGDYAQSAEATLLIGFKGYERGDYGRLNVEGTAEIADGARLFVELSPSLDAVADSTLEGVLLSEGALDVDADALAVEDNSLLWRFSAFKDGNSLDLSAEYLGVKPVAGAKVPKWATGAMDAYEELAATRNGEQDVKSLIGVLSTLESVEEIAALFPQLTPATAHLTNRVSILPITAQVTRIVREHVAGSFRAPAMIAQSGGAGTPGFRSASRPGLWIRPFFRIAHRYGDEEFPGYAFDTQGMVFGLDFPVSDNWRMGGGLAYAKGAFDGKHTPGQRTARIDYHELVASASYKSAEGGYFMDVLASGGVTRIRTRRRVHFEPLDRVASSEHNGFFGQVKIEAGQELLFGKQWTILPLASASFLQMEEEDYGETGAGALDLDVEGDSSRAALMGAGLRFDWRPEPRERVWHTAHALVAYDVLAEREEIAARFGRNGTPFKTLGEEPGAIVFFGGFGVELRSDGGLLFQFGYDLELREHYTSQILSGTVHVPF